MCSQLHIWFRLRTSIKVASTLKPRQNNVSACNTDQYLQISIEPWLFLISSPGVVHLNTSLSISSQQSSCCWQGRTQETVQTHQCKAFTPAGNKVAGQVESVPSDWWHSAKTGLQGTPCYDIDLQPMRVQFHWTRNSKKILADLRRPIYSALPIQLWKYELFLINGCLGLTRNGMDNVMHVLRVIAFTINLFV